MSNSNDENGLKDRCLELLYGASLPFEAVARVFAYGSGAVPQRGEDVQTKMVDFLVVCHDSLRFHERNSLLNSEHYCAFLRPNGSIVPFCHQISTAKWLDRIQRQSAARLYYNTRIHSRGRLIKYGVIQIDDLETDLLNWAWLYASGRLQKPVLDVFSGSSAEDDDRIQRALSQNYLSAAHAALLQLGECFTMHQFLAKVVSISYDGDVRRYFGAEDPLKVEKLVAGAGTQLRAIYAPILKLDKFAHFDADHNIRQDCSPTALSFRLAQLPNTVIRRLSDACIPRSNKMANQEELIHHISHQQNVERHVQNVLRSIVYESSWRQSLKNFITAGPSRSFRYILPKFLKGLRVV